MNRIEFRKESSEYVGAVLMWTVVTILATRLYLSLTGWPEIGSGIWHIAHILWGGLGLLVGGLVSLLFYGKRAKRIGAVVMGIGLGFFLDETGKFVSRSNDYHFQPAVMIVYIFLVILFLVYKKAEKFRMRNESTMIHAVLEDFEEILRDDLDKYEREDMVKKIKVLLKSENTTYVTMASGLEKIVNKIKLVEPRINNGFGGKIQAGWDVLIKRVLNRRYFKVALLALAGSFVVRWAYDIGVIVLTKKRLFDLFYGDYEFFLSVDGLFLGLKVFFDGVTAVLFGLGIQAILAKKRKKALSLFEYGLLVNIFLTSIFRFYFEQFSGLFDLGVDILVLAYIGEMKKLG